jgi:hypothetical protein
MGRSGTSALANTLALCGAHLPDHLLGPHESNAKGHFEPTEALGINLDFLGAFGSDWDDPTFRLQHELDLRDVAPAYVQQITEFLCSYADRAPLVVKEPRITTLTRYWFEAAANAGWEIKIVIALRHPAEVRDSLARRQGMAAELSDALWTKYCLLAERSSRGFPRVGVRYDRLMQDPGAEIERVSRTLDLNLVYDAAAVSEFLEPELRHHAVADDGVIDSPWMEVIFEQLTGLCEGRQVDLDEMTRLHDRYVAAERLSRAAGPGWSRH